MVSIALEYWDAIVNNSDASAEYQTIQAAIDANERTIWVKNGTYVGFTQDQSQSKIYIEPGSTISSACNFTGTNCSFVVGAGSTISGEIDITTGTGCFIKAENGCSFANVNLNSARNYINGGGWGTLVDGGSSSNGLGLAGDDSIAENIASQSTGGGFDGCISSGCRGIMSKIKIVNGDDDGIQLNTAAMDNLLIGCSILAFGDDGINGFGARARIIGNSISGGTEAADNGIALQSTGDDSICIGNIIQMTHASAAPIRIDAAGENCIAVGNRLDGAVTDNSGTSTVGNNDISSF